MIVNKQPGRPHIIDEENHATHLLIDNPQKADRYFWTAKDFHVYIRDSFAVECSYQTVVRFFRKQGYVLKLFNLGLIVRMRRHGKPSEMSFVSSVQKTILISGLPMNQVLKRETTLNWYGFKPVYLTLILLI